MSRGTRITTLRIQPATVADLDAAIDSAAAAPWAREYCRASWIRQAIREKLGHLRRGREWRERHRHQADDVDGTPATAVSFTRGGAMAGLVVSRAGRLNALARLSASWEGVLRMGLYQGELAPEDGTTIDWITPATFPGGTALQAIVGWGAPRLVGELAVSEAAPLVWTCSGTSPANWVSGYYVVDAAGVLQWCEPFREGPVAVVAAGNFVRVVPVFSQGSRLNR